MTSLDTPPWAGVIGEIAAGWAPGERDAREALDEPLRRPAGPARAGIWAYDQWARWVGIT